MQVISRLTNRAQLLFVSGWNKEMRKDKAARKQYAEQQESIFKATQGQIRLDKVDTPILNTDKLIMFQD